MRVTLVEFSPAGGLFHFAMQLAEGLAELGHEVQLVTGSDPEMLPRHAGVRLLPLLPTWHPGAARLEPWLLRKARRAVRALRYVESWRRLARHLAADPPDVVQWAEWRFVLDGWAVAALARRRDAPIQAVVAHTPRPFSEQRSRGSLHKSGRLTMSALRSAYAAMDVVLVLGDTARDDVRNLWPEVRRVEIVPHGDEGVLVAAGDLDSAGRSAEMVLFFGTLARYKGLDVLLDAWPLVRRHRPAARLVIAGAPADVDVAELRRRVAATAGVELQVGYVPIGGVGSLMGQARVVVAPYLLAYGSGVVALAHTCRRPVVASAVGDLGAAVHDGETGLLVPPGSAPALADALTTLLADPDQADRLGQAGSARLRADASWRDIAGSVAAIYTELLRARGGAAG
ncbi:MAG: glycosyltransferase family 4 protein [Actinomycetota bacterium]|nr:glycosyltransferase family 4 protein [Actinomycetota bacterium]